MIKFKGKDKDGIVLGFGLSEGNITRLKQGMPIRVDLRDIGLQEFSSHLLRRNR